MNPSTDGFFFWFNHVFFYQLYRLHFTSTKFVKNRIWCIKKLRTKISVGEKYEYSNQENYLIHIG